MIIVTGAAGFIGSHVCIKLLDAGHEIIGIDNINSYYNPELKLNRLDWIKKNDQQNKFHFIKANLERNSEIDQIFQENKISAVINLAAQAGVRHSLIKPKDFINSNVLGFYNLIESVKKHNIENFIYASSSSVYGDSEDICKVENKTESPLSLYAATKKTNELISHSYSEMHGIRSIGLRLFSVYGPFGRPDMAYFKFTKAILNGEPIRIYNSGKMYRDFTYVDDVVNAIVSAFNASRKGDKIFKNKKSIIYNIGNNKPILLTKFIDILESLCKRKAIRIEEPLQKGDVISTFADINSATEDLGFKPETDIKEGLKKFVIWYKNNRELLDNY